MDITKNHCMMHGQQNVKAGFSFGQNEMFFDVGRGWGGEEALTLLTNILVLFHGISNNKFSQNPSFLIPSYPFYHHHQQQQQLLYSPWWAMASSVILRFRNIIIPPIVPVNLG